MDRDVLNFLGVMMTLAVSGITAYAGVVVVQWLHRRLNPATGAELDPAELDAIRGQCAEVDALRERVAELEERVEFAERMLAQAEQMPRLSSPERRS